MIEKRAYEKAVFDIIEVDSQDFLKGAYRDDAKERILRIIEIEAPITEALLSKRLINSFSIKRLGSSLSEYFDSLLKELDEEGKLTSTLTAGEKVYYNGSAATFFRPTPDNPEEIRYSYQIPVEEALNAIIYIFERTGRKFLKKDLLSEFSKELEYQKKGSQVVSLFNKAFEEGKKKGIIMKNSSGKFFVSSDKNTEIQETE